jgi:tRNA(Arg) A34 adenosine deaminase TadA
MKFRTAASNLSNQERRHLARALSLAGLSTMRNKHGAVIVAGGRVLSVGVNRRRNDPKFHATTPLELSVHAERAAIKSLGATFNTAGLTMYIARLSGTGQPLLSRPCSECWNYLAHRNFKEVIYTC